LIGGGNLGRVEGYSGDFARVGRNSTLRNAFGVGYRSLFAKRVY
jgi:hypothetical protein